MPLITGALGGNTIDFRRYAAEGVTLLGRMEAAHQGVIDFAPDLAERLAYGDASYAIFLDMIDAHAVSRGLNLPEDPAAREVQPDPLCLTQPLRRLDHRAEGIGAVIWATGYGFDFGWIDVPVLDAQRRAGSSPRHHRGAGPVFSRPAMAVAIELLDPVRCRRRRRRARRPHRRARVNHAAIAVASRPFWRGEGRGEAAVSTGCGLRRVPSPGAARRPLRAAGRRLQPNR